MSLHRMGVGVLTMALLTGCADRVTTVCADYCAQLAMCDDETDVEACEADCADAAGNCQADEQEQALDELEVCAAESCDDILVCTVGASLECYLGI